MTKEQFIKYMDFVCKRYKALEEMYDNLVRFTGVVSDKIVMTTSIDPIIDMLAEWAGDNNGWIRWYIYEKECGDREEFEITDKDGSIVSSDSYDDIWNLIQNDKGE